MPRSNPVHFSPDQNARYYHQLNEDNNESEPESQESCHNIASLVLGSSALLSAAFIGHEDSEDGKTKQVIEMLHPALN